jgi:hypothetical protein
VLRKIKALFSGQRILETRELFAPQSASQLQGLRPYRVGQDNEGETVNNGEESSSLFWE